MLFRSKANPQPVIDTLQTYEQRFPLAMRQRWRDKLGLRTVQDDDGELAVALLQVMAKGQADFTITFRRLCEWRTDVAPDHPGNARVRDLFLDFQIRSANSALGDQSARADSLQRVELALNEPGDTGLRAVVSRFFNAWRDLSNNPESSSTRTAVLQAGASVAVTAQRLYTAFTDLRAESDVRVRQDVAEINGISTRVANLNEQIARLQVTGDEASDLRDQRDQSMDRLSKLIGVQYQNRDDGRVDVFLGGHPIV